MSKTARDKRYKYEVTRPIFVQTVHKHDGCFDNNIEKCSTHNNITIFCSIMVHYTNEWKILYAFGV